MTSFLFPVCSWFERNKWAQWVLLIVTGLFVVKLWGDAKKAEGRKLERAINKAREAETRAAMIERKTEIVTEERTLADDALEARDSAEPVASFDELPDANKKLAAGQYRPRQ